MKEPEYLWLKCKVCKKLHRSGPVIAGPGPLVNFPKLGKTECPDNPGQFAEYDSEDWIQATESEIDKLGG
ncbi:MAG: hypothetical protein LAO76_01850 [Acidobacteriia bacterium]|nr:hypothetical protein [Terriglobia bacterium]